MMHTNWISMSTQDILSDESVHVWRVRLNVDDGSIRYLRGKLNPEEKARADRFHFEKDRRRFTVARGRLRQILGYYTETPAEILEFTYNEFGKPYLNHDLKRIQFNVSHSADLALIAVSKSYEIGVDIEYKELRDATFKIAERFFSDAEVQELMQLPETDRLQGFFNCWTRKEAYIKARGKGLAIPLGSFAVTLTPGCPVRLAFDNNDRLAPVKWSFSELFPDERYAAALAVQNPEHQVKTLEFKS